MIDDIGARPRDLEPTHSAVWSAGHRAATEPTMVRPDVGGGSRHGSRGWMLLVGFAALALVGAGATAWWLTDDTREEQVAAVEASSPVEAESSPPVIAGPVLEPVVIAPAIERPEPAATIVPPDPIADPDPPVAEPSPAVEAVSAKPRARPSKIKPAAAKPAKEEPTGPEVIVRFRLEGGLAAADVKLGARVIAVRPRYDTRVIAGKYAAKWRTKSDDPWTSAGTVVIGESGEWKFLIGPSGARVSKL